MCEWALYKLTFSLANYNFSLTKCNGKRKWRNIFLKYESIDWKYFINKLRNSRTGNEENRKRLHFIYVVYTW